MNAYKHICIFSVCFITACAPHKLIPEFPVEHSNPLNKLQQPSENKAKIKATSISSWELSGAMAARNKNKGWTSSLHWVQQGANQYQIRLLGPLGGGTVLIEKKGGVVTYRDGPKKVSSQSADELLQQQTGIRLPVHYLYYWVRGLPAPGAVQSSHFDTNHHLASLKQAGYVINYTNYTSVHNVDLPSKIQLQGHGVLMKLIIKRWTV